MCKDNIESQMLNFARGLGATLSSTTRQAKEREPGNEVGSWWNLRRLRIATSVRQEMLKVVKKLSKNVPRCILGMQGNHSHCHAFNLTPLKYITAKVMM